MIETKNVTVIRGKRAIVNAVGMVVPTGSILGLVGPNGSGKTTLLRTLYAAISPDSGQVLLDGADIGPMKRREIARRIAVVPQERPADSGHSLLDMVMLGRLAHTPLLSAYRGIDRMAAQEALERVGLDGLEHQAFSSLSGGEAQRALIARALCQQADHLLLDEPTNHLDLRYQHEVLELVRGLGMTIVLVLHDLNLAARYCDTIALLNKGELIATGTPDAVLTPQFLEPLYQVSTKRITRPSGGVHLIFGETPFDEISTKGAYPK